MKRNLFLLLIIAFCTLSGSVMANPPIPTPEAKAWVEDKGDMLLDAFAMTDLKVKYQTLDDLFLKYVDLPYISKFVIGKYWKAMTKEQQDQYQNLFKRYALGVYKSFPLTFVDRVDYKVDRVGRKGKLTEVVTIIDLKKENLQAINLTFYLDKQKDGIKIVDMKLLESSLILSYRSRFQQMVLETDEDMAWFLEDFETSVKSIEINNQNKLQAQQNNQP